jgi:hypothetical protein
MFVISLKLGFHGDLLTGERVSRVPLISPGIVAKWPPAMGGEPV